VIDSNVFVAAVRAPSSASRQLLDAVTEGRVVLLVSPPVFAEYRRILPKAVQSPERERLIRSWIARGEAIAADRGQRVIPDDPDDDKFVALALAGAADAIVSNDDHLLSLNGRLGAKVLRPSEAVHLLSR
jgi:putative PIN family toxin of toxin-antitoxin system